MWVCSTEYLINNFTGSRPFRHNMDIRGRFYAKSVLGQEQLRRIWYNDVWQNKTKQKKRTERRMEMIYSLSEWNF